MGMRRNIALQYDDDKKTKIYLYTHWGADGLEELLAVALKNGKERWGDESYLARIIFSLMVGQDIASTTGYGIAPYPIDEEFETLEVDLRNQTVNGISYDEFIKNPSMFKI